MQRPAPQLSRRTALGRLSALGCLAAAPALAQSDDELLGYAPRAAMIHRDHLVRL